MCSTTLAAVIYNIWSVRNEVYWEAKVGSVNRTVNSIQRSIIDRVYSIMPKKISKGDREWMRQITLQVCN